jgi:hypothetical protein
MTNFFTIQPGKTAAPVPPGPVTCTGTAAMRPIHRVFLWAYDEAPGLVRSAAAGDTARAAYVGEVLGNFDKVLHLHHEGEDQSMYPQLSERRRVRTTTAKLRHVTWFRQRRRTAGRGDSTGRRHS